MAHHNHNPARLPTHTHSDGASVSVSHSKTMITFKVKEGGVWKERLVPEDIAFRSNIIKHLVEIGRTGAGGDDEENSSEEDKKAEICPMDAKKVVSMEILDKILEFMKHESENEGEWKDIDAPLRDEDMTKIVSKWYAGYIDVKNDAGDVHLAMLFEMLIASDYLGISRCVQLTSAKIASVVKGKSKDEILKIFGVDPKTADDKIQVKDAPYNEKIDEKTKKKTFDTFSGPKWKYEVLKDCPWINDV